MPSTYEVYFHDIIVVSNGDWFFRLDRENYETLHGRVFESEVVLLGDNRWHAIVDAGGTKTTYLEGF